MTAQRGESNGKTGWQGKETEGMRSRKRGELIAWRGQERKEWDRGRVERKQVRKEGILEE